MRKLLADSHSKNGSCHCKYADRKTNIPKFGLARLRKETIGQLAAMLHQSEVDDRPSVNDFITFWYATSEFCFGCILFTLY